MFQLFNFIIIFGVTIIGMMLGERAMQLLTVLIYIYYLAILLPSLGVQVRRLHDTGRSGWWILIALVPFVGGIVLLVFNVLDSGPDNEYGPNPKGVGA